MSDEANQHATDHSSDRPTSWIPTFALTMLIFLPLYLLTLWFGHSLVAPH